MDMIIISENDLVPGHRNGAEALHKCCIELNILSKSKNKWKLNGNQNYTVKQLNKIN